jgi:LPXTG-motif cell wall-anchored protein
VTFKEVSGVREGQVVAFEDLFIAMDGEGETATGWQLVGTHRDLADAQQTVSFKTPDLRTTLTEEQTGMHECAAIESVTLIDLVSYEGLEVGKTYSVKGTLVDKETGKALSDAQGKAMQATGTFKTTGTKGSINVRFEIDASQLAGRQVVAFESIAFNGRQIAVHANLDDSAQTVTFVDIHTTATDAADGDHEAYAGTQTKLVDRVEMRGLMPGQPYSLVTELVLADSHETLLASSTRFVPTKAATTLDVTATLDTSKLAGKKLVFLETLQREGKTLAKHCDYSDENQTVGIVEQPPATPSTPSGDIPQTGQGMAWAALLGGGGAVAAAGCVLMVRKQGLAPAKAGGSNSKPAAGAGKPAQQAVHTTDPNVCGHIRPSRTKPIPGWRPRNGH